MVTPFSAGHDQPGPDPEYLAPAPTVDVGLKRSRHHTEPSRYLLAVVSSSVVVAVLAFALVVLYGRQQALLVGLLVIPGIVFLWLLLQLNRIRLLGQAVRVSGATTPELQRAVDEVRARLAYTKRTDVFVTERVDVPIQLQSLFGVRVIVVQGAFVADLIDEGRHAELMFLLATYLGALKARYDRLNAVLAILATANMLRFINPLLNPWYRATVYSGDQLAFLCCRDLDVSLAVAFRSLVGKEMAPHIRVSGVVEQARDVRKSWVLRLSQLLAPSPHPTNRYLNLLAFAAREEGEQYARFTSELEPGAARYLEEYRSGRRTTGGSWQLTVVADVVGALVVVAGIAGGFAIADAGPEDQQSSGFSPTPTPNLTPSPSEDGSAAPVDSAEYTSFIASLPYPFADTCVELTTQLAGSDFPASLSVAAACKPPAASSPGEVDLLQFSVPLDAEIVFDQTLENAGATEGDCPDDAPARGQWNYRGGSGLVGCFLIADGSAQVVWTDADAGVISFAIGRPSQSVEDVVSWWGSLPVLDPEAA